MYTSKLIAKRIELSSSIKFASGLDVVVVMDTDAACVNDKFS